MLQRIAGTGAGSLLGTVSRPFLQAASGPSQLSANLDSLLSAHQSQSAAQNKPSFPSHLQHVRHTHASPGLDAASSMEALMYVLSPTQLGAQALHSLHTFTGLPWWASIPLTAVAFKTALLPLSLKAKAASANFILYNTALSKARTIRAAISEELAASASSAGDEAAREGSTGRRGPKGAESGPSMWATTRATHQFLRQQHKVPSFRWYMVNGALQAGALWTLTSSLKYMCASLWPGFVTEGLVFFKDLTAPPVYLQTLSTPCGTMGALLPLGIVLLYISSIDLATGARVPGIITALRLVAVPLYCISLLQPHAVLLAWTGAAATHYAMQAAVTRPTEAAWTGLRPALDTTAVPRIQPQQSSGASASSEEQQPPAQALSGSPTAAGAVGGSPDATAAPPAASQSPAVQVGSTGESLSADQGDADLLTHLGKQYARRKSVQNQAIAASCFRLALKLKGDHAEALAGLAGLKTV